MREPMARKVSLGLGIMELPFSGADSFWRWIDLCEAGGVDSIWQSDRLIGTAPVLESLSAMAALAGRTRRLRFGMNVVSLAFRDPVLLAKQCATIDYLSNGRLLPAFGIGSPVGAEWKALGIDTAARGRKADEALEIIRRLWSEDEVSFEGRFHKLKGASIAPKPVQPDLPMWIGGSSDAAIRRTARFGTGWQSGVETPEEAGRVIAAIKAALVETGRAIDEDHYGVNVPFRFGSADDPGIRRAMDAYRNYSGRDPAQYFTVGDATLMLDRIAAYIENGAYKFVFRPAASGDDDMLDQTRRLIDELLPKVAARWPHG
jgi:probable F420-dependent oxidoreductase